MNPATFKLANLHMIVTISPEARRWVNETYVSLETYAWDQARKVLDGGEADKGVSVVPTHEFKTKADKGGPVPIYMDRRTGRLTDVPQPLYIRKPYTEPPEHTGRTVEMGEWPKWERESNSEQVLRWDSDTTYRTYRKGVRGFTRSEIDLRQEAGYGADDSYETITPTEAAKWLREHGHEAEAARVYGDMMVDGDLSFLHIDEEAAAEIDALPESLAGARALADCDGNEEYHGIDINGATFYRQTSEWRVRLSAPMVAAYEWAPIPGLSSEVYTELHGPEREEVLRDFAASEAFREWEARA